MKKKKIIKKKNIMKKVQNKKKSVKKKPIRKKFIKKKPLKKKTLKKKVVKKPEPRINLKNEATSNPLIEIEKSIWNLQEKITWMDITDTLRPIILSFYKKQDECIETGCDNPRTTSYYCRSHYIHRWKDLKKQSTIIAGSNIELVLKQIFSRYSLRQIEKIRSENDEALAFTHLLKAIHQNNEQSEEEAEFSEYSEDTIEDSGGEIIISEITSFEE